MRKHLFAVAVAVGISSAAFAQAPEPMRRQITQDEDAWRKARIAGDVGFLDRFYAKEGRIQGIDGKILSRDEDIAIFRTGKIKPKFIEHGPLNIVTYGNMAVVTGVDHLGGTAFGHYGEMYIRFTDVLVRRDGRWQLIVQQGTKTEGF
jgi:ketosteroid isomerase-like protein